jgi:hypothetical protein
MRFAAHTKWSSPTYKAHVTELERRGLTIEQAIERGYEPLTADETYKAIRQNVGPTIAFACLKADGTAQPERRYCVIDPAIRKATDKKYTERFAAGVITHVRRPKKPNKSLRREVWITEGEFKADAIAEATGATAVSVPGTRCFLKDGELHPEIAALLNKCATARLAYDTDQMVNLNGVMKPLFDVAERLNKRGVKVKFVDLPAVPNLEKTGADDAIQHLGAEALLKAPAHDYGIRHLVQDCPTVARVRPGIALADRRSRRVGRTGRGRQELLHTAHAHRDRERHSIPGLPGAESAQKYIPHV